MIKINELMLVSESEMVGKQISSDSTFLVQIFCRLLVFSTFILLLISLLFLSDHTYTHTLKYLKFITPSSPLSSLEFDPNPTNISHLAFGLQGSQKTCRARKGYMEAWWRPNITKGYLYLDRPPARDLLPWSPNSPPYRVNHDLAPLIRATRSKSPLVLRFVHRILELFQEFEHQEIRWIIIGDDDTMFFVDNLVEVLSKYDHTMYYYLGSPSEFLLSDYWFSFNQAFGGGGIILSYPLAKVLVGGMERCLRTYADFRSTDILIMHCLADIGVNLTPLNGIHQNDFHGDYSGFLSSHPKELVLSLHHWETMDPIFPSKTRVESAQHLMKAGNVDQSRLFQQTICHHRKTNWTFSVSWGYSAHVYESAMPRSWLMKPIQTFHGWVTVPQKPVFMFDTRKLTRDPCEIPHIFFFQSIHNVTSSFSSNEILTVYARHRSRKLPLCNKHHPAELITEIHVFSSATKRPLVHRAECCDVVSVEDNGKAEVQFRECKTDEVIA